jgi:membrane associated rhomboid family serine protease
MANIRGVNDYRQGLLGGPDPTSAMLLQGFPLGSPQDARRESFWQMMKILICPYLEKKSFTTVICLINTLLFLFCCFYDSKPGSFLVPTADCLTKFGGRDNEKLLKFEVWRWVTPVVLHANFSHFFINIVFILAFVSRVEHGVGRKKCIIIYFLTAVAGNILGALGNKNLAVGSSTAIFGILGSMIGWITLNWNGLAGNDSRLPSLIILLLIAIFNLMIGGIENEVDNFGHLGGLIEGFALSLAVFQPLVSGEREARFRKVGFVVSGLALVGGLVAFYLKL